MDSLIVTIFALASFVWYKLTARKHPPFPPGPPSDPLIGHLRVIPRVGQETFFYELGKVYGDVLHFSVLGRSMIVLNSVQAAIDLLDKRGANYSDRPYFPVFDLMGFSEYTSLLRYGKGFQLHRRLFQQHLNKDKSMTHRPIHTQEACALVQKLLEKPEHYETHFIRFSTTAIMRIAYGHRINSDSDPYFQLAEEFCRVVINCGSPGGTLVDAFPLLKQFPSWFPGTYYAEYARSKRHFFLEMREYPYREVQKQLESGIAKPSFLLSEIEALNDEKLKIPNIIEHIQSTAATLYLAGAETTSASLSHFLLAMVLHPECQTIVQEEIDTIIGSDRLPEFSDRSSLPYLEGIVQETLRWNPTLPLGLPHLSLDDDVYRGMFIPKGSIIIANTRAMTLDESVYADPFRFNPARYLPKPTGLGEPHPMLVGPFGFGRRICPGRYLANDSLWMAIATILATLKISKGIDKDGKEITPELSFVSALTTHPSPFPCRIEPRSDLAKSLVMHADMSDVY